MFEQNINKESTVQIKNVIIGGEKFKSAIADTKVGKSGRNEVNNVQCCKEVT